MLLLLAFILIVPITAMPAYVFSIGDVSENSDDEMPAGAYPLVEQDIAGVDVEMLLPSTSLGAVMMHNAVTDESLLWPNGVVPFLFANGFEFEHIKRPLVEKAINGIENATCIRFVKRSTQTQYLLIERGLLTCSSYIGRQPFPKQSVKLDLASCFPDNNHGIAQHELMHALGFWHEQSRTDRDDYVEINPNNIRKEDADQFLKHDDSQTFGEPYDFGSLMHYGRNEMGVKEDGWTIRPLEKYGNPEIGQRRQLSPNDIKKINKLYRCRGYPGGPPLGQTDEVKEPVFVTPHRGCLYQYSKSVRLGRFTVHDVDPSLCTYLTITTTASLATYETVFNRDIVNGLNALRSRNPSLKILFSVGEFSSPEILQIARSRNATINFGYAAVRTLRNWGFDGLDFVVRVNTTTNDRFDKALVAAFFRELARIFTKNSAEQSLTRLALSVVVFPDTASMALIDAPQMDDLVDIVNVVAYDLGDAASSDSRTVVHHSPTVMGPTGRRGPDNMQSLMESWASQGFAKQKLVAGIPFFGRGWWLTPGRRPELGSPARAILRSSSEPSWPYYEICHQIKEGGVASVFNETIQASYIYSASEGWWIGHNDVQTVRAKASWIRNNGFGGVYAWDISRDDFGGDFCGSGRNPLLQAIKSVLG
ncbi:putative Acidic mammalian chitinase [Hypsibius exemplaris]|uniref:Metalloendopeptidase n=1 Tax=Hypsibius exemplaris TaxID=2072580 RepID=A0A9X6NKF3_HYPEX|nr:putative Acidic mammalian chitinase [Hypsibius exemplaris]